MILGLIDRLFAAMMALIFLQIPQFVAAYQKILSGHTSELLHQKKLYENLSIKNGKPLMDMVQKFLLNSDPDIKGQGEIISQVVQRHAQFTADLELLNQTYPLFKPFVLLWHFNYNLIQETAAQFQLGLTFTVDSCVWGLFGVLIGYASFKTLRKLVHA